MRALSTLAVIGVLLGASTAQDAPFSRVLTGLPQTELGASFDAAFADVDGDGDQDLFVANNGTNAFYVNDGNGEFVDNTTEPLGQDASFSADACFGDVDGDGDQDLVVVNRNGQLNFLYINQGGAQGGTEGAFQRDVASPVVSAAGNSFTAEFGDKDNDGDLDLVVANADENFLFQNNAGTFVKVNVGVFVTDVEDSRDLACGDLDGDGDAEIFVSNLGNNSLYDNASGGVFTKVASGVLVTDGEQSWGTELFDGDNDGDLDVVVANLGADNAYYENQGGLQGGTEGLFQQVVGSPLTSDGGPSFDVAVGDYNCDGWLDVAFANVGDNYLYQNTAGSFLATSGEPTSDGGSSNGLAFGDADSDGGLDLYFANTTDGVSNVNFLYTNTGPGRLVSETDDPLASDAGTSFDADSADVDSDGDLDVFVSRVNGEDNALWINQGGTQGGSLGEFLAAAAGAVNTAGGDTWSADFADVDGDGDADLFVSDRLASNSLWINQGGLQAGAPGDYQLDAASPLSNSGPRRTRSVSFADVDDDGDQDAIAVNSNDDGNQLYVNQGGLQGGAEGTFLEDVTSPVVTSLGNNFHADWGDVDADGDLDLFVAARNEDNALFINQGGTQGGTIGEFVQSFAAPVAADGGDSFHAAFGDRDNDGDLDLVVANSNEANALYTNDGNLQAGAEGSFTKDTDSDVVQLERTSRHVEWGDLDADGDMDLFVANANQPNELFCNLTLTEAGANSSGVLLAVTTGAAVGGPQNSRGAHFADLDGDLDDDLVIANFEEDDGLFFNASDPAPVGPWVDLGMGLAGVNGTPQLNGTGTLAAGDPVGLQNLFGASNASLTMVVGIFNISAPFKGGTLVPSPDFLLGGLATDGSGFFSISSTMPPGAPSGTTFYFQNWIVDAAAPQGLSATNGLSGTTP